MRNEIVTSKREKLLPGFLETRRLLPAPPQYHTPRTPGCCLVMAVSCHVTDSPALSTSILFCTAGLSMCFPFARMTSCLRKPLFFSRTSGCVLRGSGCCCSEPACLLQRANLTEDHICALWPNSPALRQSEQRDRETEGVCQCYAFLQVECDRLPSLAVDWKRGMEAVGFHSRRHFSLVLKEVKTANFWEFLFIRDAVSVSLKEC